jgi:hypothetical protein
MMTTGWTISEAIGDGGVDGPSRAVRPAEVSCIVASRDDLVAGDSGGVLPAQGLAMAIATKTRAVAEAIASKCDSPRRPTRVSVRTASRPS